VVEQYRANGGKVEGFESTPLLLLHHTGAKSGTHRVNPLAYLRLGDSLAVFGSKGGSPHNPDWYYNLLAHPQVEVELPGERYEAIARVTSGAERERIFDQQKVAVPGFVEYERKTLAAGRQIPVIVLDRV
jgi:deazaflavin-dependent oxidoreductase (nitroreductase family)